MGAAVTAELLSWWRHRFSRSARGDMTTLFGPWAELGSFENLNALLERFAVTDDM